MIPLGHAGRHVGPGLHPLLAPIFAALRHRPPDRIVRGSWWEAGGKSATAARAFPLVGGHARTVQHQYSSIATRCVGASSLAANGSQDGFLRSSGSPNQEAAAPEIGEEREMC